MNMRIRIGIVRIFLAAASLIFASKIAAADQPFDVTVTARSTPVLAGAKPIGEIQSGTHLTVTQTNGDWYLITLPGANPPQQGWIRKSDVQTVPVAAKPSNNDWKATDARLEGELNALVEKLEPAQRQQLQEADGLMKSVRKLTASGEFAKALEPAQRAVNIRREILGDRHHTYADSLSWLGSIYQQLGSYAKAESIFKQNISIYKEALGEKHPDYGNAVNNLAGLYHDTGAYAKAEPLYKQSLEIEKEVSGEESSGYAISLSNLATLYREMKEYDKSESHYLQSLAIKKQVLGERDPSYLLGLSNLASLYQSMYELTKAEALCKQVLATRKEVLGEQHPDYGTSLNGLANVYRGMGYYAKAEPLYRQAVQITKDTVGENNPGFVDELSNLAGLYQQMSDYARAEPLLQRSLEIREATFGKNHPFYASGLADLADLYLVMGEYAKAEPRCRQALKIRKQAVGERSPHYASSLSTLAHIYHHQGNYAQAEPLYRQAAEIWMHVPGEKSPEFATGLSDLAAICKDMGDYAQAEPLYKRSLDIEKTALGERDLSYATGLSNLAAMYKDMGDYTQAEPMCKQALEIRKQVLGEKHPEYANSLNNLAALYAETGNYGKAEPLYRQALEIDKQTLGGKHPDYAKGLSNLAFLYLDMGDSAKAEPLCKQVLEIQKQTLGEKHPDYAVSMNILATIYMHNGENAQAEPLFRQVLEIRKDALGEKHPDYSNSLQNLALLYTYTGDYAKAEPLYRQSMEIDKQLLGEKSSEYATGLHNLALLRHHRGDYGEAIEFSKQALEIEKQTLGEKHPKYELTLDGLASTYYAMRDFANAQPLAFQALKIARERLNQTSSVQSERQQLRMAEAARVRLDNCVTLTDKAGLPAEPIYAEVLAWKGAVTARQQAMRQLRSSQQNPRVAELYQQLANTASQLDSASRTTPKPGQEETYRQRLEKLSEDLESSQQKLAAVSADFQRQLNERNRTPDDIRRVLPKDTVLVDFLEYGFFEPLSKPGENTSLSRLMAFIVRPDQPVEEVELGKVEPIAADIADWRRTLGAGRAAGKIDPGADLRRLVWDKLQPHLQGAKTVLISPDGVTARFPWLALPGEKPGTYLIDDVAIAIVPVPSMLPEMLARSNSDGGQSSQITPSLLLVGDVDFGADPGKPSLESATAGLVAARGDQPLHWQSLPGTRDEVAAIKTTFEKQFGHATPEELTGARATKSAVRSVAGSYQYLHISTHGFFAPPQMKSALASGAPRGKTGFGDLNSAQDVSGFHPDLLSGLVLAGANRPVEEGQEDGILTALEVSQLDLSKVELATLSACETGLGQTAGGEGLLGLQRAFQLAGAKTTMASLWQVPDRATQALMSRFYENLWRRRMPKLEALREAQRWLIRVLPASVYESF
jgi:tetratricopeptide (TPR) repeat protein